MPATEKEYLQSIITAYEVALLKIWRKHCDHGNPVPCGCSSCVAKKALDEGRMLKSKVEKVG